MLCCMPVVSQHVHPRDAGCQPWWLRILARARRAGPHGRSCDAQLGRHVTQPRPGHRPQSLQHATTSCGVVGLGVDPDLHGGLHVAPVLGGNEYSPHCHVGPDDGAVGRGLERPAGIGGPPLRERPETHPTAPPHQDVRAGIVMYSSHAGEPPRKMVGTAEMRGDLCHRASEDDTLVPTAPISPSRQCRPRQPGQFWAQNPAGHTTEARLTAPPRSFRRDADLMAVPCSRGSL
jgi:hypothetical protein